MSNCWQKPNDVRNCIRTTLWSNRIYLGPVLQIWEYNLLTDKKKTMYPDPQSAILYQFFTSSFNGNPI